MPVCRSTLPSRPRRVCTRARPARSSASAVPVRPSRSASSARASLRSSAHGQRHRRPAASHGRDALASPRPRARPRAAPGPRAAPPCPRRWPARSRAAARRAEAPRPRWMPGVLAEANRARSRVSSARSAACVVALPAEAAPGGGRPPASRRPGSPAASGGLRTGPAPLRRDHDQAAAAGTRPSRRQVRGPRRRRGRPQAARGPCPSPAPAGCRARSAGTRWRPR